MRTWNPQIQLSYTAHDMPGGHAGFGQSAGIFGLLKLLVCWLSLTCSMQHVDIAYCNTQWSCVVFVAEYRSLLPRSFEG